MSLGSTYNNNQNSNRNTPEVTVYSGYRMNNAESQIDATCLTARFWKTNLCLSINPRKNTGNDEVTFDMDNGITIYLSHTKARILKNELELFLKDPVTYNCSGVNSGAAVITISNGVEYGKNTPVLTIRKLNDESQVVASFAYEFKSNYYFALRNYDGKNYNTAADEYKNIEIEQLITLLDQYVLSATGAQAFSVLDNGKFATARTNAKIDAIAASLGVELPGSSNGQKKYNNHTHFNINSNSGSSYPSSSASYGTATLDDLE